MGAGWTIKCHKENCKEQTWAENIVDLIENYRDKDGWFLCDCGGKGYIERTFELQEEGQTWKPYLRGIIPLGDEGDTYQPFVFMVSYKPKGQCKDIWFCYYKDTRHEKGGRLKLGYGPGGPPVLGKESIIYLLKTLKGLDYFSGQDIKELFIDDKNK